MSMFHGRTGRVKWHGGTGGTSSDILNITNWTFDATAEVSETTAMSDTNYWKTYLAGFKDWTASVDYIPTSDTLMPGLAGSDLGYSGSDATSVTVGAWLEMAFDGSDAGGLALGTLIGEAVMTGLSINQPTDGIVTATVTFQGNAAPHFSDAFK